MDRDRLGEKEKERERTTTEICDQTFVNYAKLQSILYMLCVCVCVREREGEREIDR